MNILNDMRFRALCYQIGAIGLIAAAAWTMFATASDNLAKQNIATGFGFLARQAGFVISETAIAY